MNESTNQYQLQLWTHWAPQKIENGVESEDPHKKQFVCWKEDNTCNTDIFQHGKNRAPHDCHPYLIRPPLPHIVCTRKSHIEVGEHWSTVWHGGDGGRRNRSRITQADTTVLRFQSLHIEDLTRGEFCVFRTRVHPGQHVFLQNSSQQHPLHLSPCGTVNYP